MKIQILTFVAISFLLGATACKEEGFFSKQAEGAFQDLTLSKGEPLFSFGKMNKVKIVPGENIAPEGEVEIAGWAMNPDGNQPPDKVFILVNGTPYTTEAGIIRDDVAKHFDNPAYRKSGYRARFARSTFQPGVYTLEMRIVDEKSKSYFASSPNKAIKIRF